MYDTTAAPGNFSFQATSSLAVMEAASEQPAARSGRSTIRSWFRIDAVSAMKCTPQKTMTGASVRAAACDSFRESATRSATS